MSLLSGALSRRSDRGIKVKKKFDPSSWKTPYGTMMLLCMIFFMILYAISFKSGIEYEGVIAKLQSGVSGNEQSSVKDVETAEKMSEIFGAEGGIIQMDAQKIKIMLETPVLFDSGSAELKAASRGVLHKVALVIKETDNKINVAGHTDDIPFTALPGGNFELSTLRAFNVIRYFIDIEKIPIEELLKDKEESLLDIENCKMALKVGIVKYSGGSVQERLEINQKIVEKIDKELERRIYDHPDIPE
ncbi:OmpA family protein [bacterium]|nr:OmpA family protein [bacterium]